MIVAIPTFMREDTQKCFNKLPDEIKKIVKVFTHSGRAELLRQLNPTMEVIDLGVTDGIADVRQKLIDYCTDVLGDSKVLIMDDGCQFYKRTEGTKMVNMTEAEDFLKMFTMVETKLGEFPMVGISDKAGNNRVEESFKVAQRSYSCYGVNTTVLRQHDIRFDGMYLENKEIKLYEDFHLILDILTKGLENVVCYDYAFGHSHGKKGGNNTVRTNELQKKCIVALSNRYPDMVKLVKKEDANWKTGDGEDFRWEVQVSWKKAWEFGKAGGFKNTSTLDEFF
jgi:hypothetical protein